MDNKIKVGTKILTRQGYYVVKDIVVKVGGAGLDMVRAVCDSYPRVGDKFPIEVSLSLGIFDEPLYKNTFKIVNS